MSFAVEDLWIGHRLGPAVLSEIDGELRPLALGRAAVQHARMPKLDGAVMPGLIDRHVHLGLVNAAALADTAVVEVNDLGWVPNIAREWKIHPPTGVRVKIAGEFLTAIGGYPAGRPWAPPGSVRELAGPADAVRAVAEAASNGHDLIKAVLHTGAPLMDDATLSAIVQTAHQHRLSVGVHVEGSGQARRAFEAGADMLVHVPWTESLQDDLLSAMAGAMTWISTFAIHRGADLDRALDNARRFLPLGGRLAYGTDMGNDMYRGSTPVGPRAEEITALGQAGLRGDALLGSLTGPPGNHLLLDRAIFAPIPLPDDAADVAFWMNQAQRLTGLLKEAATA